MTFRTLRRRTTWLLDVSGASLWLERRKPVATPNAVFLWIPKSAGTTVYETMGSPPLLKTEHLVRYRFVNAGLVTFGHMDYAALVQKGLVSPEFDQSAFKFAFARNPYDRIVSLYFYSQRVDRLSKDISFLDFCRQLLKEPCEPVGLYNSIGLSQCNPQSRWLEGIDVDYVGRVESIDEDMLTVMRELGFGATAEVPKLNATQHRSYRDYFCDETRQIVEHLYDEDFRQFGYHKESSQPPMGDAANEAA